MSAQSSYLNKKGLTVKDLVTIGIFTALFFVFELIQTLRLLSISRLGSPCSADLCIF